MNLFRSDDAQYLDEAWLNAMLKRRDAEQFTEDQLSSGVIRRDAEIKAQDREIVAAREARLLAQGSSIEQYRS